VTDLSNAVLNVLWEDGEFALSRAVRGGQLPRLLMMPPAAASPDGGSLKQVERSHIRTVLRQTNWRIDRAQGRAHPGAPPEHAARGRMQRLGIRRMAHEGE
jgi:hypothetical protein